MSESYYRTSNVVCSCVLVMCKSSVLGFESYYRVLFKGSSTVLKEGEYPVEWKGGCIVYNRKTRWILSHIGLYAQARDRI